MNSSVEDVYSGFDNSVEHVDHTLARTGTAKRLLTGHGSTTLPHGRLGTGTSRGPHPTGLRTGTGGGTAEGRRPVTAVKAAGYVSSRSPTWRAGASSSGFLSRTKTPSLSEICKALEVEVHALMEEAADLLWQGRADQGHSIAQKALMKVEELQQQCDLGGIQDNAIVDLQFAVRICLAQCAQEAGMDQEALALLTGIAKNSEFQMAGRIRVNIGNIFAKRGNWTEAIKQYRMALDQIPTERQGNDSGPYASVQCRLLRNIGVAFLHQGMYADARDNFEAVLRVKPDVTSAFNRLVAVFMVTKSVGQSDYLKAAFRDILSVPQLHDTGINPSALDGCVSVNGQLHSRTHRNSQLVLTAAKLIAPRLQPGDPDSGFQWCLDELKTFKLVCLTHDVMMAKASYFLHIAEMEQAAQILKQFEKHGGSMRVKAATNLSFLYLLEGNVPEARRYANLALSHDEFHVQALVNSGNCCFALAMAPGGERDEHLSEAWTQYEAALRQEPDCVEAIYNMGLVAKAMEQYDLALEQLIMLNGMIANQVEVLHQIADLYLLKGDHKRARKMLHLTYDFVGSEPGIMAVLGIMCAEANNRDESLRYLLEAHEQCPNMDTLAVICAQYVNDEKYEAAAAFFQQAALMQPTDPKWALMVASCHRRGKNYELALKMYEQVHDKHPNNVEALKFMVQLAGDLQDESKRIAYEAELIKVERIVAMQDHVPKLSSKQTDRPEVRNSHPDQNAQGHEAVPATNTRPIQQGDGPSSGSSGMLPARLPNAMAFEHTRDVLGEDLLPGLGDM